MEKRRERRIPVKDPVSFGEKSDGKSNGGKGTTVNLSANGCAFESGQPIDSGAIIQLELCIPNYTNPVKVDRARVSWKSGGEMGLEFLNMGETSKARLDHYVDSLSQKTSNQDTA